MDNSTCKKLTVLLLFLSFGTTFGASLFGFNFGPLRDAAANNIDQIPKFINQVINRHKEQSVGKNPNAFQIHRETVDNDRVAFPHANTNAKCEDQQNWGYNNSTSLPHNWGSTDYNAYKPSSPSPNKYPQRQESDPNSAISFSDNFGSTDYNGNNNTFNPTTNKDLSGNSFVPTPTHFINKVAPGNNLNYASSPVNIGSRGSYYDGGENSKPLLPGNIKNNPADEYLSEHTGASDTDSSTDYSTIIDYDWTTTSTTEELSNRIGEPPAIVASILG